MSYQINVDHPENDQRKEADWTSWWLWSQEHAPLAGVGIDQMAAILTAVCAHDVSGDVCRVLDLGGTLSSVQARLVAKMAGDAMSEDVKAVFDTAVNGDYGVTVEFRRGAFGAPSASEYRAKEASA